MDWLSALLLFLVRSVGFDVLGGQIYSRHNDFVVECPRRWIWWPNLCDVAFLMTSRNRVSRTFFFKTRLQKRLMTERYQLLTVVDPGTEKVKV